MASRAQFRLICRLAWNGWPDTPETRATLAKRDETDPISSAAWDRVVLAVLTLAREKKPNGS